MTVRKALEELLDVVECAIKSGDWKVDGACDPDSAIVSAKKALAQPEQEPVAWLCEPDENGLYGLPLSEGTCTKCFPVYTTPPQRKPLTDEQVWNDDELMKLNAVMMLPMEYFMRVVRAIEAAHGIKE